MAEENEKSVKETSEVTFRATIDVEVDPSKLNPVQTVSYHNALAILKNIRIALSHVKSKTENFTCTFTPSQIEIEHGEHHYRITCTLNTIMENTDDGVYNLGKYTVNASIVLTTDSADIPIVHSSAQEVKLVQDIEALCQELSTTHKYYMDDYEG